ncbi:uncharacterized protein C8A04DRAFT_12616 [Dichotomopilus funicola]|uniref:DUF7730 domain-containing protein n=1 Tax=Dichotomopilus funicola TaxID=1934379 RepID=A0AAN6V294_9PEZI|nr:hypothetical protein C8A04DRAFT_12616 [Dichotomopilus funicola]
MDFLRQALRGKLSFHRGHAHNEQNHDDNEDQQNQPYSRPHALDTLPSLPFPRRPLTPFPPNHNPSPVIPLDTPDHINKPKPNTFPFLLLPPELRNTIYRLVLTHPRAHPSDHGREIHIDMAYSAAETSTPHSTAGARLHGNRRWIWRASSCHRHPDYPELVDRCAIGGGGPRACAGNGLGGTCGVGKEVLGLMMSCRTVYREVVDIVYAENTFHIGTGALVLYTEKLLVRERAAAVRSLVVRLTLKTVWDYADEHLGIDLGLLAYEKLIGRIPDGFPGLRRLVVCVEGKLERGSVVLRGSYVTRAELDPETTRDYLLGSMDGVVKRYGVQLGECVLMMGEDGFDRVMGGEREKAEKVESEGDTIQFWSPVSVTDGKDSVQQGYWVRRVSTNTQWEATPELDMHLLEQS